MKHSLKFVFLLISGRSQFKLIVAGILLLFKAKDKELIC